MIPYKITFAVSLFIYTTTCQGSTFVYEDFLAYPKYKVGLTEKKIPESNIFGDQLKNTQQVGWWNSKVEQYDHQKQVIMMSSYNQPFLCTIPTVTPKEKEEEEEENNKYKKNHSSESSLNEAQHTIENGLKLLEPLEKNCLYYHTNSYWTYEYCHKKHVRQFHIDPTKTDGNDKYIIDEKNAYILGKFPEQRNKKDASTLSNKDSTTGVHINSNINNNNEQSLLQQQKAKNDKSSSSAVPGLASTTLKQIGDKKLLVQHWGQGTLCDKTNQPRTTDIQFQCDMHHHGDHISNYQELSTCHYLMTISTPRLCDDSMLTSTKKPKIHQIECNPIVPDHETITEKKLLNNGDVLSIINNDIEQHQPQQENKGSKEDDQKIVETNKKKNDNNDDDKEEKEKEKEEEIIEKLIEEQLLEVEKTLSSTTSPETLLNTDTTDLIGMINKLSKQMDELQRQQEQLQLRHQQQQVPSSTTTSQRQLPLQNEFQQIYILKDNGQLEMVTDDQLLPNTFNSEISKAAQALLSQFFMGAKQTNPSTKNNLHEKGKKPSPIEESETQQRNRKVYEKSYYNIENNE